LYWKAVKIASMVNLVRNTVILLQNCVMVYLRKLPTFTSGSLSWNDPGFCQEVEKAVLITFTDKQLL
jgi:hypothetical protein